VNIANMGSCFSTYVPAPEYAPVWNKLQTHYNEPNLLECIMKQVEAAGVTSEELEGPNGWAYFSSIDQFHAGKQGGTETLLEKLSITSGAAVIDIGCGMGGVARRIAAKYQDVKVIGLDLSTEYVRVAKGLTETLNMNKSVEFMNGDMQDLSRFSDGAFDFAVSISAAMNVSNKHLFFKEAFRVLKSGGKLGIWDLVRVPGAKMPDFYTYFGSPSENYIEEIEGYVKHATEAGFIVKFQKIIETSEILSAPPACKLALQGLSWDMLFTGADGRPKLADFWAADKKPWKQICMLICEKTSSS